MRVTVTLEMYQPFVPSVPSTRAVALGVPEGIGKAIVVKLMIPPVVKPWPVAQASKKYLVFGVKSVTRLAYLPDVLAGPVVQFAAPDRAGSSPWRNPTMTVFPSPSARRFPCRLAR